MVTLDNKICQILHFWSHPTMSNNAHIRSHWTKSARFSVLGHTVQNLPDFVFLVTLGKFYQILRFWSHSYKLKIKVFFIFVVLAPVLTYEAASVLSKGAPE